MNSPCLEHKNRNLAPREFVEGDLKIQQSQLSRYNVAFWWGFIHYPSSRKLTQKRSQCGWDTTFACGMRCRHSVKTQLGRRILHLLCFFLFLVSPFVPVAIANRPFIFLPHDYPKNLASLHLQESKIEDKRKIDLRN
jgi:hypothetical protein